MRGGCTDGGCFVSLCQISTFYLILFDRGVQKYYHAALMPAQTVIDSLEFARTGQVLCGNLPIAGLTRLKESLFDAAGEVQFELKGARDAHLRPALVIDISGVLQLQCQRCLEGMAFPLRLSNTLLLDNSEHDSGLEEEDVEWIEASSELDVASLIEDEILLSLPYSPRHEEGRCREGARISAVTAESSAFAKLAELKRKSH
jgi:uncharacterized protein